MGGQSAGLVGDAVGAVAAFDGLGSPEVEPLAPREAQLVVQRLADQGVTECVRQRTAALVGDEQAAADASSTAATTVSSEVDDAADEVERHGPAEDGGRGQHVIAPRTTATAAAR